MNENRRFKILRGVACVAAIFVITFVFMPVRYAVAKRLIPDDNLAYPVLITLKIGGEALGSGSGIYLNTGDGIYLVTAKHVIEPGLPDPKTGKVKFPDLDLELLSYSKDLPIPQKNVFSLSLAAFRSSGAVKTHETRDVAVIKIGTTVKQDDGSLKVAYSAGLVALKTSQTGILAVSMDKVLMFDQVLVGNEAMLYGYPKSLGIPDNPQFDPLRPLLRKGLIAGADLKEHSLVIDGAVYRGNSGGPVFEIDQDYPQTHYYLVGITTEFVPLIEATTDFSVTFNSGYSVAVPMDFVIELIRSK